MYQIYSGVVAKTCSVHCPLAVEVETESGSGGRLWINRYPPGQGNRMKEFAPLTKRIKLKK